MLANALIINTLAFLFFALGMVARFLCFPASKEMA
jgi:hypothetical protein